MRVVPVTSAMPAIRHGTNTSRPAMYASLPLGEWWVTRWGQAVLKPSTKTGTKAVKKTRGSHSTRAAALLSPQGQAAQVCVSHSTVRSGSLFGCSCRGTRGTRAEEGVGRQHAEV